MLKWSLIAVIGFMLLIIVVVPIVIYARQGPL